MMFLQRSPATPRRAGITLTEILIAIMILGVGLVSLATLFPLGLLRLRQAARSSRSAYLAQSADSEIAARGLLTRRSFSVADLYNLGVNNFIQDYPFWYISPGSGRYDPWNQDTPAYGGDWFDATNGIFLGAHHFSGPGLPVVYDPLWRYQTGNYLDPINQSVPEYRFASGIGFVRPDPADNLDPSAHGLQRLTNFNRPAFMPSALAVPQIFVSPEDYVWQDTAGVYAFSNRLVDPNQIPGQPIATPSSVVPDLNQSFDASTNGIPTQDWRFSWIFTGQRSDVYDTNRVDGSIVVFENRPFGTINAASPFAGTIPAADGERVVEAIFGYSASVLQIGTSGLGYGVLSDRSVLLRWPITEPDPEIRAGSWIADVTYERAQAVANTRFPPLYSPPGQRCNWYQVAKVAPAADATPMWNDPMAYRSMMVTVRTSLLAKTLLRVADGAPYHVNAALVSPHVVNVLSRTYTLGQ